MLLFTNRQLFFLRGSVMNKILKRYREGLKMTQDEISKIAGCTQSMWGQAERGERPLPPDKAVQLEIKLGFESEKLYPWLGDLKANVLKNKGNKEQGF
jgi:transcriptional regulator with XRE-family HTH domain